MKKLSLSPKMQAVVLIALENELGLVAADAPIMKYHRDIINLMNRIEKSLADESISHLSVTGLLSDNFE